MSIPLTFALKTERHIRRHPWRDLRNGVLNRLFDLFDGLIEVWK